MLLDYNIFYRNFGLRRIAQLTGPAFGSLERFQLPRRSIVHMAHGNPTKFGPSDQDVTLQGFTAGIIKDEKIIQKASSRPVWMYHVVSLAPGFVGNPIKQPAQPLAMARQYHQHYKRFRLNMDAAKALTDEQSLLVLNYDIIPHTLRYPRGAFNHFFEWYNIERTVWTEVAKLAALSDRPQFIVRQMPQVLPARSSLQLMERMNAKAPAQKLTLAFDSAERLFLAEIWKWLGPNRKDSLISLVPRELLGRVNIAFIESGKWTTVNLGVLDSWRKPSQDELMPNEVVLANQIDQLKYQSQLLRFFMSVTQLRTVAAPEVTDMTDVQVLDADDAQEIKKELATVVTKVGSGSAAIDPITGAAKVPTIKVLAELTEVEDNRPADTRETVKLDAKVEAQIEADVAELEKLRTAEVVDDSDVANNQRMDDRASWATTPRAVNVPVPALERLPHNEALMQIANNHLNAGSMSAAQYRHYEKMSIGYKTMPSPDPSMRLEEFITIPPETLKISESASIPDIASVPDKSMLKSSLLDFDKRYTQEVMQRDIASMAMCFAQAGYAVTGYEVEKIDSLMGAYNMYTVRVMPTDGIASTIRFKLPLVDADGSYMSNGVKYNLRKQRTELPIRKTAPDTVALTSYYGKAFVRRSEKKVNNYAMWLVNGVMAKWLDDTDLTVTDGHPGDMSDNEFKAPRVYSILASGFSSFMLKPTHVPADLGDMTFHMSFDHTKREELYGKEALARFEQNGAIIAGKSITGTHYFLIGKSSTAAIVAVSDGKIFSLASMEAALGLDRMKAPVDIAVMKVAGSAIPLGVILAYEMGLEPMLAMLKAQIRRVPAGTRLNLGLNEEAVVFNDESIVFDKNDHLVGMFLGGFNEYHRTLRRYNVHLFNSKEVYLNVLEASGLGVRYIREMDLFYQMFIDPITHDILVEMGEPTDMRALLIRAGSMLITDEHPDEFDGRFMRLRGYERMAGAVYSEMVRSIRTHNSSAGKSRTALNMDPFAVFTNIQTDPSKAQVNDINPIQNLKEQEAVTYSGVGGRNSRTMTKKTRTYHPNDMGLISSDTVDSSDVAINTYTSADPQFTSLRGLTRPYTREMGNAPLLSTSVLLAPGTDRDD